MKTETTFENTEYVLGNTKSTTGDIFYHILWLDTGARTCGFDSALNARNWADAYCLKWEK